MVHKLLGVSGVGGTSLLEIELLETSIQFSFLYFPPGTQLMSNTQWILIRCLVLCGNIPNYKVECVFSGKADSLT